MPDVPVDGVIASSQPILAVADVAATVRFFRDKLGFTDEWLWGEPPDFGGVNWGKVGVMFSLAPDLAQRIEGHEHHFMVHGIDALYERHRQNGVTILSALAAMPWGLREYVVRDPNGYHLRFGEHAGARSEPGRRLPLPDGLQLIERRPTLEEYARLLHAVGWKFDGIDVCTAALKGSLCCIVAELGGEAIGMARVVGDGATAYYIQDVIVLPGHQKRGVGSALMKAALQYVNRTAPGKAMIGLFTGRMLDGFYAQFGFEGPESGLYGMMLRKS